ncbi:unnamed protein product, partial [marine sediment metagenome]
MAVEKAFTPRTVNPVNPKSVTEKAAEEGEESSWSKMAKESKGMLEYANTQKLLTQMAGGEGNQGIKVEGKVNLGEFNPQEQ